MTSFDLSSLEALRIIKCKDFLAMVLLRGRGEKKKKEKRGEKKSQADVFLQKAPEAGR